MLRILPNLWKSNTTKLPFRMFSTYCQHVNEAKKLVNQILVDNPCVQIEQERHSVQLHFQYFQSEETLKKSAELLKNIGFDVKPTRTLKNPLDVITLDPLVIENLSIEKFISQLTSANQTRPRYK